MAPAACATTSRSRLPTPARARCVSQTARTKCTATRSPSGSWASTVPTARTRKRRSRAVRDPGGPCARVSLLPESLDRRLACCGEDARGVLQRAELRRRVLHAQVSLAVEQQQDE